MGNAVSKSPLLFHSEVNEPLLVQSQSKDLIQWLLKLMTAFLSSDLVSGARILRGKFSQVVFSPFLTSKGLNKTFRNNHRSGDFPLKSELKQRVSSM